MLQFPKRRQTLIYHNKELIVSDHSEVCLGT